MKGWSIAVVVVAFVSACHGCAGPHPGGEYASAQVTPDAWCAPAGSCASYELAVVARGDGYASSAGVEVFVACELPAEDEIGFVLHN